MQLTLRCQKNTIRQLIFLVQLIININLINVLIDTPCTAASHLRLRNSEISKLWFADRHGCAEKPMLGKTSDVVSIPKLKVIQDVLLIHENNSLKNVLSY